MNSPRAATGQRWKYLADGKTIGKTPVRLERGSNQIRAHANLSVPGPVDLTVSACSAPAIWASCGSIRRMTLRRPKVLYISQGSGRHRCQSAAGPRRRAVRRSPRRPDVVPRNSNDVRCWSSTIRISKAFPPARKDEIEDFVEQGGGFFDHRRRAQRLPGRQEDRGRAGPHAAGEGGAAAFAGRHLRRADHRQVVVDGRPQDGTGAHSPPSVSSTTCGPSTTSAFSSSTTRSSGPFRCAAPKTSSLIKRLVAGITPDGGTQIAPALSEAFRKIAYATRHLQAHRAAHGRHLRRRRFPRSLARSRGQNKSPSRRSASARM